MNFKAKDKQNNKGILALSFWNQGKNPIGEVVKKTDKNIKNQDFAYDLNFISGLFGLFNSICWMFD
jgi:hypothetical protein